MSNLNNDLHHIFGEYYARLLEQGINLDDKYLQKVFSKAYRKYNLQQLETIVARFEQGNSSGKFYSPNGMLVSALKEGFWL